MNAFAHKIRSANQQTKCKHTDQRQMLDNVMATKNIQTNESTTIDAKVSFKDKIIQLALTAQNVINGQWKIWNCICK